MKNVKFRGKDEFREEFRGSNSAEKPKFHGFPRAANFPRHAENCGP